MAKVVHLTRRKHPLRTYLPPSNNQPTPQEPILGLTWDGEGGELGKELVKLIGTQIPGVARGREGGDSPMQVGR